MARHIKLVKKLQQVVRDIKSRTRGKQAKMDLREEIMADSPGVLALIRGHQRRLDSAMGIDVAAAKPEIAVDLAGGLDRHDFDGLGDWGVRMTLGSGLVEALGLQAGDKVEILTGEYAGRTLEIEAVDAALDELRFADDAAKATELTVSVARLSSAT